MRSLVFWVAYLAFAVTMLSLDRTETTFSLDVPLAPVKVSVWIVLAAFLSYSIYCSAKEDLIKSLRKIAELHWGRQVCIDLYIGLTFSMFIIYLNSGSLLVVALWLLPLMVYVNLTTLLYVAIHFDSLVAHFV